MSNNTKVRFKRILKFTLLLFFPDEMQWRNLVVFLEDQKIRFYKIEEREGLRNFQSSDWPKALAKVGDEIINPFETLTPFCGRKNCSAVAYK